MKSIYTQHLSLALGILCSLCAIWVGYAIAYACNACFTRVNHAVVVRTKMHRCMLNTYKHLSAEYAGSINEESAEQLSWSAVESELYGPQRQTKKRAPSRTAKRAAAKKRGKKQKRVQLSDADHKSLMTHRGAPFSLPLANGSFWMSSRFGPRPRPDGSAGFHYGIDLAANRGTPVYAARSGVVIYAGHDNGYGKTIVIKHGSNFKTRYAHLDRILVSTGETVVRGSVIGAVGATGHVRKKGGDGSHLHFEIYYQGKRVDPLQFLPDIVS